MSLALRSFTSTVIQYKKMGFPNLILAKSKLNGLWLNANYA